MTGDIANLVRQLFTCYEREDHATIETLIAEDYTFTSPYDDRINRKTYFERCWPNSARLKAFRIVALMTEGENALVLYECETKTGNTFRNTEYHRFADGKLHRTEVFFGDPPAGIAREQNADFIELAQQAWKQRRAAVHKDEANIE